MKTGLLRSIYRVDSNHVFMAIRRGFMLTIPLVITGCIAALVNNFPIPAYQLWRLTEWGVRLTDLMVVVYNATVGFMSAYLVMGISYYFSENYTRNNPNLQIQAMLTALGCFIASFGASFSIADLGTTGVFTAMIISLLSTRLFFLLENTAFRRFNHNKIIGADVFYRSSMTSIFPVLIVIGFFALTNVGLLSLIRFGNESLQWGFENVLNLNDLITELLIRLFSGIDNELANGVLYVLMINFLWFFGIHGGNALDPVGQTLFVNAEGEALVGALNKSFLDNFALIGGCGSTICLVLALLIAGRSRSDRQLAKSALPFAVFNINELLVFGLPVVLNPMMFIPFILVPLLSLFVGYLAMATGLMPMVTTHIQWTTPPLLSGYLCTGSISGAVVQLVIIALGTAVYIPFVRLGERMRARQSSMMLEALTKEFIADQKAGHQEPYLTRRGNTGATAKAMVGQLRLDIEQSNVHMYYQPQFDNQERVVGAEALLRWQFLGQRVYPPLTVALAQEDGLFDALTWKIISVVLGDANRLLTEVDPELQLSINITAQQLDSEAFVHEIISLLRGKRIALDLVLEVTEETSLSDFDNISHHIALLNENGIRMAIDDFSMGQTSLNYLHSNRFQYVKLDGELVRQVVDNGRSRDIIRSIVELGKSLDFEVVAEYVENRQIRDILLELGCQTFQGYLYSPALAIDDFIEYCRARKK